MFDQGGRRAILAVVVATVGLLVVAASAQGSIRHNKAPNVRGPLQLFDRICDTERDASVKFLSCRFLYALDPALDGDPNRDYAVIWTQGKFVTRRCQRKVWSSDRSTPDVIVHRKAPGRTRVRARRTKRFTSKLAVKGATGTRLGSVKKRFRLQRGTLTTKVTRRQNGSKELRQAWRGRGCPKRIGLAYGAEYSVPAGALRESGAARFARRHGGG